MKSEYVSYFRSLVGSSGLEPPTSRLSGARSNHLSYEPIQFPRCVSRLLSLSAFSTDGGDEGNRTLDPLLAGQVLSQLSYTPDCEVSQAISCLFVTLRSLKIEQQQTHTQKLVYSLAVRKNFFGFGLFPNYELSVTPLLLLTFSIERR